jgi:hypothetical protein
VAATPRRVLGKRRSASREGPPPQTAAR